MKKKIVLTFVLTSMFGLMPLTSNGTTTALSTAPATTAAFSEFKPCPRGTFRVRRSTRKGKKITNALIAGGVGAAIGAGIGGGRGALIGLGSGSGGYLVYRYVRDRRGRCVARRA